MKKVGIAIIAAALLLHFQPVVADDPPARGEDAGDGSGAMTATQESAPAPGNAATGTIQVEEVPNGAASMEPAERESPEERSERAFVENIWNSP